jgi:shikimate kinase
MSGVKLFLLGAPCAGKSTLVPRLRESLGCPVLDMDDELLSLNGGVWPDLEIKRALTSQVIAEASRLVDVVLAHSIVDDEQVASLRTTGWIVGLLDAPEEVLRTRADERLTRDGWSNVEWLPMHLSVIEDLSARHTFEYVFDGTLPIAQLVRALGDVMSGQAQR